MKCGSIERGEGTLQEQSDFVKHSVTDGRASPGPYRCVGFGIVWSAVFESDIGQWIESGKQHNDAKQPYHRLPVTVAVVTGPTVESDQTEVAVRPTPRTGEASFGVLERRCISISPKWNSFPVQ